MTEHPPETVRAVEHELTVLLRRGRGVSWDIAREVHPHLEPSAYGLLLWLRRSESVRLTDLAARLGVSKGTLSRQIQALEELGLVRREPDPQDGRASRLSMSDAGQRRFDAAREGRLERFHRTLDGWSTQDVADFARLLSRFNETYF